MDAMLAAIATAGLHGRDASPLAQHPMRHLAQHDARPRRIAASRACATGWAS